MRRQHGCYRAMDNKKLYLAAAVIICLVAVIVITNLMTITDYESYEGRSSAIVKDIKTKRVYAKAYSYLEYEISYCYSVNDIPYEKKSSWITGASELKRLKIGDELDMRYDKNHPEDSLLELEKGDSIGWLWFIVIFAVIIFVISRVTKR